MNKLKEKKLNSKFEAFELILMTILSVDEHISGPAIKLYGIVHRTTLNRSSIELDIHSNVN